jgi:ATP-binding cassette subfamily F protein 3
LLVSHDRHFLKEITNRVFKVGDGKMQIFEGSFSEYLESVQGDLRAS